MDDISQTIAGLRTDGNTVVAVSTGARGDSLPFVGCIPSNNRLRGFLRQSHIVLRGVGTKAGKLRAVQVYHTQRRIVSLMHREEDTIDGHTTVTGRHDDTRLAVERTRYEVHFLELIVLVVRDRRQRGGTRGQLHAVERRIRMETLQTIAVQVNHCQGGYLGLERSEHDFIHRLVTIGGGHGNTCRTV